MQGTVCNGAVTYRNNVKSSEHIYILTMTCSTLERFAQV